MTIIATARRSARDGAERDTVSHARPPSSEPVLPCTKCGTTGGAAARGYDRPTRTRGLCQRCYYHEFKRVLRDRRIATRAREASQAEPPPAPVPTSNEDLAQRLAEVQGSHVSRLLHNGHAPRLPRHGREWRNLTPAKAARRVRKLWRVRPARLNAWFSV